MTSPSKLVSQLAQYGITVHLAGDSVRVVRPPGCSSWDDVPPEARPFLAELKRCKQEVAAYLRGYVEELGNRYPVHQTRPRCMEAGHCCWVSEADCELYPLVRDGRLSGLCRERVPKGAAGNVPAD
jgi:hypothetical protein